MNEKYAHKDDKGRKQTIKKHLEKTAELAEKMQLMSLSQQHMR